MYKYMYKLNVMGFVAIALFFKMQFMISMKIKFEKDYKVALRNDEASARFNMLSLRFVPCHMYLNY